MKKLSIVLCFVMALVLSSCGILAGLLTPEIPDPSVTVEKLEKAINDKDMDAMLDCLDPAFASTAKIATGILGGLLDLTGDAGIGKFFEEIPALLGIEGEVDFSAGLDELPVVELETINTKYVSDTEADVEVQISVGGNTTDLVTFILQMKLVDNEWFIEVPNLLN